MYVIKKDKDIKYIDYMIYDTKSYDMIINNIKVSLYDKKYYHESNIEFNTFINDFNNIALIIFNYLYNPDNDDGDSAGIFIGELDRLKNELDSKYIEFLKREEYSDYLDKISFMKQEIYNKIELDNYKEEINELISGKSR